MTTEPLTLQTAKALGEIIDLAQRGARVKWLVENDNIMTGVMRSVGDAQGNFLRADDDIREAFVRVSATFEHFIPVMDMVRLIKRHEFAVVR